MNPVFINIGNFEVRWYGVLIAIGMLIGLILSDYNCKKKNLDFNIIIDAFPIILIISIIGARLYYVIFEFSNYKDNLIDIFNIRQGGLAIHGGIIFASISAYVYSKIRKINLLEYLDVVVPSMILAQSIGRWGNFMNGEAHGDIVTYEFISKFPEFIQKGMFINGHYYEPTFLYESIWNFIVFIILMVILHKTKEKGIATFAYISLYSTGRVFIEGLRTDSLMFFNIRAAQLISIVGIIVGILGLFFIIRKRK